MVGLFIGSLVFGWLTDRSAAPDVVFDLLAFVLLSLAQLASPIDLAAVLRCLLVSR